MRYLSLFSGIEAASVAWEGLGWEPVAFCEIDPFPSAVLAHRFPEVPNLGDITKVDWSEFNGKRKPDLIVGGSPCQSFSVAGCREGLAGESGLMFEYIRAVRELRPRCFLWENVPGALSSEQGEAFRQLLSEMDEIGYGMAWRVLDAQFFGVAQRRERVFLVGCLGDPRRAAEVLFEPDGLRWDTPSSRDKRKELAEAAGRGVAGCGGFGYKTSQGAGSIGYGEEISPTLLARRNDAAALTPKTLQVRCGNEGGGKGALVQDDMSATLSTTQTQTLFDPYGIVGNVIGKKPENGGNGGGFCGPEDAFYTLTTIDRHGVAYREEPICLGDDNAHASCDEGMSGSASIVCASNGQDVVNAMCAADAKGVGNQIVADGKVVVMRELYEDHPRDGRVAEPVEVAPTVAQHYGTGGGNTPIVREGATFMQSVGGEVRYTNGDGTAAGALCAGARGIKNQNIVHSGYTVRRLTPRECERLQGFPDDWTLIPYRGKEADQCPDGPRYKALGNSMAVPVMRWIGERIERAEVPR